MQNGASDIHFRPGDPPTYRVNGALRALKGDKLDPQHTKEIALHLISDPELRLSIDTLRECDASYAVPGVSRFRVNIYRQRGSLSAILRVIPAEVPTLERLNAPDIFRALAASDSGLVLVAGSTGSGKSTTLAAMVDSINKTETAHILTIEDPIEFLHKNQRSSISQREVGADTDNYRDALRSALRQDPDVIVIGELLDLDTIDIALKAAETGYLVLSTVPTTDVTRTLGRLITMFPPEEQHLARMRISDMLRGIICQRLLPKADGMGRVMATEILLQTRPIQDHIVHAEKTPLIKEILEKSRASTGMQSFDQHLVDLVKSGQITVDTARAAGSGTSDFERAITFD